MPNSILVRAIFLALMVIITAVSSTAWAQSTLAIQVIDDQESAVHGATVTFLELDREQLTSRDGWTQVDLPFGGSHTLLVEAPGFSSEWVELDIDTVRDTQYVVVLGTDVDDTSAENDALTLRTTTASPLRNPVQYQPMETLEKLDLQRRSANSYGEMLDGSAGVAARSFGPAPSRPVIRGLDGERVLVLQNGERTGDVSSTAHDHHIAIDPLEADRIDIVRGPASLLYGSSALGGVVNIMDERIPRQWDEGLFSEAALYGAAGQTTGAGALSAGYGFDESAVRARVSHRQATDMRTPGGILPDTGIQGTTADMGASKAIDDGLIGASVGLQDITFGLPDAIDDPDESVELRSRRVFLQTHAQRDLSGFFESLEWRLLANQYGHEEIEIEPGPQGISQEDLELSYGIYSASTSVTLPHREVGPIDRGALGFQLRGRDLSMSGDEVLSPDSREGSAALYVFEEIPVTEPVRLQFGVRPEVTIMQPRANSDFEVHDETRISPTISGSAGIHIQPSSHFEMGAQVARAHRVPIIEELYSDAAHLGTGQYEIGDPDLDNEIGHGADMHTRFITPIMDTQLSVFYNHISGFIFLEPTGDIDDHSGYPIHEYQGANARLVGAEWTTTFRLWREMEFRSTLDAVRGQRLSPTTENLPSIPPLRGRFEAGWNGDELWSMVRLRAAASQNLTAPAENRTSRYALIDVEGGFRLHRSGAHHLNFRLANAFDTAYRDHLSRVRGLTTPMPGRSLHATYRWTY